MQKITQPQERAADLYRLALLLTGQRALSIDVTLESLDVPGPKDTFFANWMLGWSRRLVIAKALAAIRTELAASASRVSAHAGNIALPANGWSLDRDAAKVQLERALLSIDAFPRCALLLIVFEGVSDEDAAILLDADRNLVEDARNIGLRELTRNLAAMQGWTSSGPDCNVITGEMQHA